MASGVSPIRIFSTAGDALGFAVRRFETIMRVAWLPVVLLLIVDMATVFALVSVDFGRLVTFSDLTNGANFGGAKVYAWGVIRKGVLGGSPQVLAILGAAFLVNLILASSFMAPLIRFAGLGERPAPGLARAPFGADQARFSLAALAGVGVAPFLLLAPVAFAALSTIQHVETAMASSYVSFPDPNSLHTIDYVRGRDVFAARGDLWIYEYGWLGLLGSLAALVAAFVGAMHFRRQEAGVVEHVVSGLVAIAGVGVLIFLLLIPVTDNFSAGLLSDVSALGLGAAAGALLVAYFGLRLTPYPGLAVCHRTLAPPGLFRLTRRWNLIRLLAVLGLAGGALWAANTLVVGGLFPLIVTALTAMLDATEAYGRLIDGKAGDWVRPFFVWLWATTQVIYQVLWSFFSYGVLAGLLGRLYRDSIAAPTTEAPTKRPVWAR